MTQQPYDAQSTSDGSGSTDTRSLGAIVSDISRDMSTLMHQELELAKTEMKAEFAKADKGAGMLGVAGLAGHFTLFFLTIAVLFLLDNAMPVELASLRVALLWGIAAAVLAARGRKELKAANPQLPAQESMETVKAEGQYSAETIKTEANPNT